MKQFLELKKNILDCRECKEEFGFTPRPIHWGHQNAKIMQISQAPSLLVHNTGKPFNDLSGKKLRNDWYQIDDDIFYNQDIFYIASVAHCYPGKSKHGGDRMPPKKCAKKWLTQEMDIVNNQVYVIVGSYAAKFLFPKQDFTSLVFNNQQLNGKLAFVLPHPSPLNHRWFKKYPEFEAERMVEIRKIIHTLIKEK